MSNTKDLLKQLVKTSFKLRYNNSVLGLIWVILKPFLMFLILYFVWTNLFGNKESYFAPKLMLGIVIWTFFNEGVIFGMNGLLDKASIILKVNFNRQIAVISSSLMSVINLTINLVLFVFIFAISNTAKSEHFLGATNPGNYLIGMILFLLFLFALYLIILGISFFLSIIIVRIRDLQHVMELFFAMYYWLTPVLFTYAFVVNSNNIFYALVINNPIGWPIEFGRSLIVMNQSLSSSVVGIDKLVLLLAMGVFLIVIGNYFFKKKVSSIAEYF